MGQGLRSKNVGMLNKQVIINQHAWGLVTCIIERLTFLPIAKPSLDVEERRAVPAAWVMTLFFLDGAFSFPLQ